MTNTSITTSQRVLSGMRVTGKLHLGHYHGVLKNWVELQHQYECFFFAADWHALTTHYTEPAHITEHVWDMFIDWLAAGVNPASATLFIQSHVPETAELHLLLSMITPLSWLERIPSYKDQQENMQDKDLSTYGFLGYPLLQSADVLLYKSHYVPVGEDQLSHIELIREVARRFNFLYGREINFEEKAQNTLKKMDKKNAQLYIQLRKQYQELGEHQTAEKIKTLLETQHQLNHTDKERLLGYFTGLSKTILPEPEALLTENSKLPGLDGRKMSKSYHNTIGLREDPEEAAKKIRTMQTDPARVRRHDPGDPQKCPVFALHKVYSAQDVQQWVQKGCVSAGIGCLECKQPLMDAVKKELTGIRERAREYEENPQLVKDIVSQGSETARKTAQKTLSEIKEIMGMVY